MKKKINSFQTTFYVFFICIDIKKKKKKGKLTYNLILFSRNRFFYYIKEIDVYIYKKKN